jgi:ribosomal protein L32
MTEDEFEQLEPLVDEVYDRSNEWFESQAFAGIRAELHRLSDLLPPKSSVSVDVVVRVFDDQREQDLPLLTTGIVLSAGHEPHPANSDSTVHRYVVNGEICKLPHDRCPNCWQDWDFKLQHRTCQHCGFTLGKEVKLLVDSDVCPYCEQGKVSMTNPTCDHCGFILDPATVTWG